MRGICDEDTLEKFNRVSISSSASTHEYKAEVDQAVNVITFLGTEYTPDSDHKITLSDDREWKTTTTDAIEVTKSLSEICINHKVPEGYAPDSSLDGAISHDILSNPSIVLPYILFRDAYGHTKTYTRVSLDFQTLIDKINALEARIGELEDQLR